MNFQFLPYRRLKKQARELTLFLEPVSLPWQNRTLQIMVAIASGLALLILSGISIAAMGTLVTAGLFIFLILDRILGIEMQFTVPNIRF